MHDVLKIMNKEHTDLESLFQKFLLLINDKNKKAIDAFNQFKTLLNKHFQWEEKILFPLFEKNTGLPGEDISFVLRNEHDQIKKLFLNKIDEKIAEGKFDEIKKFIVGLEEMLKMHRNLETEIFYPWFDDTLDYAERERVILELKNSRKQ
jgi:iron-sulfur cluster repair protein YtfE (RIC family)